MAQELDQETFDRLLASVIDDNNLLAWDLLQIPGIYEILAEHYNNQVIEYWESEQEEE